MSFNVGDIVSIEVEVTQEMVQKFAEATGDFNPIHFDEEYAKTTRFGRPIAHGIFSAGLISRALAMNLGIGGIYMSQTLKFINPVYVGDILIIELKVRSLRESKGIGIVETTVSKKTGEVCVKGEATIMKGENI